MPDNYCSGFDFDISAHVYIHATKSNFASLHTGFAVIKTFDQIFVGVQHI
jgi:hypothetical protein